MSREASWYPRSRPLPGAQEVQQGGISCPGPIGEHVASVWVSMGCTRCEVWKHTWSWVRALLGPSVQESMRHYSVLKSYVTYTVFFLSRFILFNPVWSYFI